jgi:hypothetical protein
MQLLVIWDDDGITFWGGALRAADTGMPLANQTPNINRLDYP